MSPEMADSVFFWANWVLVVALVLGVVATFAVVVSGIVRDKSSKLELAAANERAAKANERAANLEKQAAEARERTAQIERLTKWRRLSAHQRQRIVDCISPVADSMRVLVQYQRDNPEAALFGQEIFVALQQAKVNELGHEANSYLQGTSFGLHIMYDGVEEKPLSDAFSELDKVFSINLRSLAMESRRLTVRPNVIVWVGPSLPVEILSNRGKAESTA